jgi:hypothetical protein
MTSNLFIAWDGDRIGKLISHARMNDEPDELRRVASSIERGNQLWKSWAENHAGSVVSMGGDEGLVEVPPTALNDLPQIKSQYEECVTVTVSIGIGMKLSEAFKAVMAAKLRGRNKSVFFDKKVDAEIEKAQKEEPESEAKKIVDEYLSKAQAIHHVGQGGGSSDYQVQEHSMNPEIQQAQDLEGFKHQVPEDINNFEAAFHQIAAEAEKKDQAFKASKSTDLNALKQKVAQSLQAIHQQLPQLAEIKQAAPETYAAVIGVVQGLIAMGRQLQSTDQQLAKAIGVKRKAWTGGGLSIPATGTPERQRWDQGYTQAIANYFTEGKTHKLKLVKFPMDKVDASHMLPAENDRTRLYHRMVRGGDKMPPGFGQVRNGRLKVTDGMHRLYVAKKNKLPHYEAYVEAGRVAKSEEELLDPSTFDMRLSKADLMPGGLADSLRPEDFDPEQLAIGTQVESEHTDDPVLAREIAMDHLSESADYYKEYSQKEENLEKDALQDKEELDPSEPVVYTKELDKGVLPEHIQSMRAHHKLVPGQILDSRHIVIKAPSGKNAIRGVSAGMVRDLADSVSNPVGPSQGNPTSARNKPSRGV